MRFRVVTWNIHKGIGGLDRLYRIERVVGALLEMAPDVALLQEVAHDLPRAGHHDQLELLAKALNLPHVAYSPQHRFARGGYGNAILCRYPLDAIHAVDLTIGTKKKRGALSARARMRLGRHARSVHVVCLHLGLAASERASQLARFLDSEPFRGWHRRTPILLGGDLNDLWGTLGPRHLEPAGFVRAGRPIGTFPSWMPVRPLDGLFSRGDAVAVHQAVGRSRLARTASDHLPLIVDVQLRGPAP